MFKLNLGKRLEYIRKQWLDESVGYYGLVALALMLFSSIATFLLMVALARYLAYVDMDGRQMNVLGVCVLAILAIILIFGKDE